MQNNAKNSRFGNDIRDFLLLLILYKNYLKFYLVVCFLFNSVYLSQYDYIFANCAIFSNSMSLKITNIICKISVKPYPKFWIW